MTNRSLARSYLRKATDRFDILDLLLGKGAFSDVPTEEYSREDAEKARSEALFAIDTAHACIPDD